MPLHSPPIFLACIDNLVPNTNDNWSQGRLLVENHGVDDCEASGITEKMRTTGVRWLNVRKNLPAGLYAFNWLQQQLLPQVLGRPLRVDLGGAAFATRVQSSGLDRLLVIIALLCRICRDTGHLKELIDVLVGCQPDNGSRL